MAQFGNGLGPVLIEDDDDEEEDDIPRGRKEVPPTLLVLSYWRRCLAACDVPIYNLPTLPIIYLAGHALSCRARAFTSFPISVTSETSRRRSKAQLLFLGHR